MIVSSGAKQSLYNLLSRIVDPQDEVIDPRAVLGQLPRDGAHGATASPVIVTPEDGSFVPRFEEIEDAFGSYTKALIVNSPNNPSGAVYPDELIAEIVELCESRGVYLIMDDIYHRLVFDGARPASAYACTDRDIDESKVIVVNGVSKLYGMTGFRIGWTIAPQPLVEVMKNVQSQTTSCPSAVSMAAAEGALTGVQSDGREPAARHPEQPRRDAAGAARRSRASTSRSRYGTFYCLPDFRAYSNDSEELSQFLLEKALVVTVPGKEFGVEGHLRPRYCGSVKDITEGVARIRWALDPSAPNEIFIGDRRW